MEKSRTKVYTKRRDNLCFWSHLQLAGSFLDNEVFQMLESSGRRHLGVDSAAAPVTEVKLFRGLPVDGAVHTRHLLESLRRHSVAKSAARGCFVNYFAVDRSAAGTATSSLPRRIICAQSEASAPATYNSDNISSYAKDC